MTLDELHQKACHYPLQEIVEMMRPVILNRDLLDTLTSRRGYLHHPYLAALVAILEPKRVVELGTGDGASASFMMATLARDGVLVTIEVSDVADRHLESWRADPRLERIRGNDLDSSVHGKIGEIDFLYIDAEHVYDQVSREWKIYFPKVVSGGTIAMDDIHLNDGMTRFWDEIGEVKLDTGKNIHGSGFGLVRKN